MIFSIVEIKSLVFVKVLNKNQKTTKVNIATIEVFNITDLVIFTKNIEMSNPKINQRGFPK